MVEEPEPGHWYTGEIPAQDDVQSIAQAVQGMAVRPGLVKLSHREGEAGK